MERGKDHNKKNSLSTKNFYEIVPSRSCGPAEMRGHSGGDHCPISNGELLNPLIVHKLNPLHDEIVEMTFQIKQRDSLGKELAQDIDEKICEVGTRIYPLDR